MSYLPESVKKELADIEISEDVQPTEEDVIITEVTKKTETVKNIPTKCPELRTLFWYKLLKRNLQPRGHQ